MYKRKNIELFCLEIKVTPCGSCRSQIYHYQLIIGTITSLKVAQCQRYIFLRDDDSVVCSTPHIPNVLHWLKSQAIFSFRLQA